MTASMSMSITENSTSVANNTSNVTVKVAVKWAYGSYCSTTDLNVTINGTKYTKATALNPNRTTSGSATVFTKTLNIKHNADGTKKLSASASWYVRLPSVSTLKASASKTLKTIARKSVPSCTKSSVMGTAMTINTNRKASSFTHTITAKYGGSSATVATKTTKASVSWTPPISWCTTASGTCTFTVTTYSGSTNLGSNTCSTSLKRPATSTLSVGSVCDIGAPITITTGGNYKSYTHKLFYSFGGLTNQTAGIANAGAKGSTTFTPPTTLMNKIPSATSGVATLTLQTLYSSTVLATVTKNITLNVPASAVPQCTGVTVTDTTAYFAKYGAYVTGKSVPQVTVAGTSVYGATITSYKANVNGTELSSTSGTITGSAIKSGTITGAVIDSRGRRSNTSTATVTLVPYSSPAITRFVVNRCRKEGEEYKPDPIGTSVEIIFAVTLSSLNNKNTKDIDITWINNRTQDTGALQDITFNGYAGTVTLHADNFPVTDSCTFTITVKDDFSTSTLNAGLSTGEVIMDFNEDGKHIAIGKISEKADPGFSSAWDGEFPHLDADSLKVAGVDMTITSTQYDALVSLMGVGIAKLSDWMYPVGSVVASVKSNFDPNKIYNGTWVRFAKGQTLVGVNEADTAFTAGKSGGEKTHALTVAELAQHAHSMEHTHLVPYAADTAPNVAGSNPADMGNILRRVADEAKNKYTLRTEAASVSATGNNGSGTAHNNLQPYTTVFYWQRTA